MLVDHGRELAEWSVITIVVSPRLWSNSQFQDAKCIILKFRNLGCWNGC
jgi:hypothetical protein